VLALPGRLDTLTGGYGYDRRVSAGLLARGWSVDVRELDDSFPFPTSGARAGATGMLASLPDETVVLFDGLAFGALAEEAEREGARLRFVALVHHPLAEETGIAAADAEVLEASERRALATARHVVVTSRGTAAGLGRYGVAGDRLDVIEPGTDRAPLAAGSTDGRVHLLCVASLVPRKGHDILFRALAAIPHRGWCLTCVGSLERHAVAAQELRALARQLGIEDHVVFAGEADDTTLPGYYAAADLFVLPTLHEGYGMVVAEALARGLPIVSTRTGAIGDLVGEHAGIIVAPGDADAFSMALSLVLDGPDAAELRRHLARGARQVRETLPTWDEAARLMDDVLVRVSR
jgi:glycosyltransferase involved in cell wall biosynthesis